MPPKKGKRGPKKGTKTQKVTEDEIEKLEDTSDVKSDQELLEDVHVNTGVEVDMEIHTEKLDETKEMKLDLVDKNQNNMDMENNNINKDNNKLDNTEMKVDDNEKLKEQNNKEVDMELDKDKQIDNFNIDLDVDGSSPEMLVEPELVYEQDMIQDFTLEELNQYLKEVIDSLLKLSKELEQLEDEEEEEGAIKEDEVPFDRFPDVPEPSTVLLILNLPPELDNNKIINVFTNQSGLVSNAIFVNKTQMRVHFTTQKAATTAKNTLDNLKLYNRKLQVLYARDFVSGNVLSHMNFPYNISPNEFPERKFNKYQNLRNNYNEYNVPPPPTVGYTGPPQDRYKVVFNRYKLANNTLYKILMEFYEEINLETQRHKLRWDEKRPFYDNLIKFDKMYEKIKVSTRYLLLGNMKEIYLEDSNRMHDFLARYTNTTYTYEYVMLPNNYPEYEVGEQNKEMKLDLVNKNQNNMDMENNNINKDNNKLDNTGMGDNDVDMVNKNQNNMDMENNKEVGVDLNKLDNTGMKKWLLLIFDKNRDASVFYTKFMNSIKFFKEKINNGGNEKDDPDGLNNMLIKYSCPIHALDTLWIGNVTDLCAYFVGEDEFYSFFSSLGNVKYFKLVYESSCMFVTFQDTNTSTKVYNFLNALSPKRAVRLYNLRNKNHMNLIGNDNNKDKENNKGIKLQEHKLDNTKMVDSDVDMVNKNQNNMDMENNKVEDLDLDKLDNTGMKVVEYNKNNQLQLDQNEEHFLDVEKADDLLNVDFSIGRSDNSYVLGQKLLNAIKRRSDSKELIENLLNTNEYTNYNREQDYILQRNGRQYRREYQEVWRRERGKFDRRYREPYGRELYNNRDIYRKYNNNDNRNETDVYNNNNNRDTGRYMGEGYNRNRDREYREERDRNKDDIYNRHSNREYNRFRQRYPINKENRVDKFGRTIRSYDKNKRDDPWKGNKYNIGHIKEIEKRELYNNRDIYEENRIDKEIDEYRPAPPSNDMDINDLDIKEPVLDNIEYCKLLKRGKYICTVNAKYIRGDPTCRIPELLDVNQRANPERLKNCLGKSNELSLWKLEADSKEDNPKYESLCEYLISKNRVALVQEGPFDVYIVPPNKQFEQLLNTPDSNYMYAYILPRAP